MFNFFKKYLTFTQGTLEIYKTREMEKKNMVKQQKTASSEEDQ